MHNEQLQQEESKMEILKKEWKLFREKLAVWQENYIALLNKECIALLSSEDKKASEKFWELEKQIKKDKKHPRVIMEMSKSEAIWNIRNIAKEKACYDNRFSSI